MQRGRPAASRRDEATPTAAAWRLYPERQVLAAWRRMSAPQRSAGWVPAVYAALLAERELLNFGAVINYDIPRISADHSLGRVLGWGRETRCGNWTWVRRRSPGSRIPDTESVCGCRGAAAAGGAGPAALA